MAKVTFIDNCLAYLKSDEKSVVTRVAYKAQKACNNEIRNANQVINNTKWETENKIEALREKLIDAKDALKKSYFEIDIAECKTSDKIDNFVDSVYLKNISNKVKAVKEIEEQIKAAEEFLADTVKEINEGIEMYKEVLNVLQLDQPQA